MSVFERKREDRLITDDTKPLTCTITDAQNTDGHIEYTVEVCRHPDQEYKWKVNHRYSDFAQLHTTLRAVTPVLPLLPPKKVFGNTDRDFINERKVALQKYLENLLELPVLCCCLPVKRFLDPTNYSRNFQEEARQNVHMVLRSGGSHEVTEALTRCGTRIAKEYFLATPLTDTTKVQQQHVLWWSPFGPDRVMNLRDTHATLTALVQCQHPYIVASVSSVATEAGVCVIRPWFPQGSVRDHIHQAKPQSISLSKYTSNEKVTPISERECAVFGRQVLEALLFLHDKALGHGHIHTGNLVIDGNTCRLLDLENQVVGLPCHLRHHLLPHRRLNSIQAIDVYCFGHTLYHMLMGRQLGTSTCDAFPDKCPPLPRSVLESILSSEACKNGLPTVAGLLTHPFFNQVPLHSYEKPSLRLPSSVKQAVALSHQAMLTRLAMDQKKVRQQRKLSKAEAFVSKQTGRSRPRKNLHLETNGITTTTTNKTNNNNNNNNSDGVVTVSDQSHMSI
ncbi:hypothetical protein Pcinc_040166 [Petrolisthes cinctipes]|uniref:PX domain-containing protein kinase-like protein n=1 Tax=Petrolisthes cinctipes TaxID=88211 RepID=A0AAE1EID3_PETCI|nr:hypothetical protein Pcinc_040166 [Petrolisthes cinctipes]